MRTIRRFGGGAYLGALFALAAGCAEDPTAASRERQRAAAFGADVAPPKRPAPEWKWQGGGSGAKRIVIDLGEQRAYFYRGGEAIGWSDISSGREGLDTPAGTYSVIEKDIDHRSSLYGAFVDSNGYIVRRNVNTRHDSPGPGQTYRGASMRFFLRFTGGYGMHAGYLPGYPASHGCIRMPLAAAARFYEEASLGTPVIVRR